MPHGQYVIRESPNMEPAISPYRLESVRRLRWSVEQKIQYLLRGMLFNSSDTLFEEMRGIDDDDEELEVYFNTMRLLRSDANTFVDHFRKAMDLRWRSLLSGKPGSNAEVDPAAVELIDAQVAGCNSKYGALVTMVDDNLRVLLDIDIATHPLQPEQLYLTCWDATEGTFESPAERLIVLRLFSRFVMDRIGIVLASANDSLTQLKR